MRACGWSSVPASAVAHARAPLRAASTSASTSACTSSGGAGRVDRGASGRGRRPPAARRPRSTACCSAGALVLEAVALAAARRGRRGGSISSRKVRSGTQAAGREPVDALDLLHPQPARSALVGERGVEEAVGHHHAPVLQRRADHPRDQLRAGGGEQQRLGLGAERHVGVLQQVAHALAGRRAARLAHAERRRRPSASASSRAWVVLPERSMPSKVTNRPRMRGDRSTPPTVTQRSSSGGTVPGVANLRRPYEDSRHRRRRLHRLEPRRRPGRRAATR